MEYKIEGIHNERDSRASISIIKIRSRPISIRLTDPIRKVSDEHLLCRLRRDGRAEHFPVTCSSTTCINIFIILQHESLNMWMLLADSN
jgi:hypothetical protein